MEAKAAITKEAVKAAREHPVRNRCTSSYAESGTRCNGCVFDGIPLLSYDEPGKANYKALREVYSYDF
ncbi:hypothetical protein Tco_0935734, partial [Tanacetum coccineum]